MDNMHETVDEGAVHEERRDGAESPDREPTCESSGEQLCSEVQVHASAEAAQGSPDYMDTRDEDKHSCSSSSSSDDDEAKPEKVAEESEEVKAEEVKTEEVKSEEVKTEEVKTEEVKTEEVKAEEVKTEELQREPEPVVEVQVEEVNGEVHSGSRRSSASSASSASPGDPCDDPPIQPKTLEEDNADDGMLMAYTHTSTDSSPEESVEYSLDTLENVSLDESSAAPADPNQPGISLFVKKDLMGANESLLCSPSVSKSERVAVPATWFDSQPLLQDMNNEDNCLYKTRN
ncbi:chloride intracellular channel protein 5b isoform X5 [Scomber scombrus]|uniref:Chloride intracellular channel protein 5b isoform X5 n=1 Tax=Scomber scombrus TaxID=13677 RepID=A0AAV1NW48_SCOSC